MTADERVEKVIEELTAEGKEVLNAAEENNLRGILSMHEKQGNAVVAAHMNYKQDGTREVHVFAMVDPSKYNEDGTRIKD